jgi:hypothetical protein
LLAGLSPGASSSPVGLVVDQLRCTLRSSIGGCGFRAICLTEVRWLIWAARFCRTIPETCSRISQPRIAARVHASHLDLGVPTVCLLRAALCRRRGVYRIHILRQQRLSPRCNSCKYESARIRCSHHDDTAERNVDSLLKRNRTSHPPIRVIPPGVGASPSFFSVLTHVKRKTQPFSTLVFLARSQPRRLARYDPFTGHVIKTFDA